jgi:hypothetical protein
MKIIKIQGGLGNQMFQYAYGRNLELQGKKVVFDTSFFNGSRTKSNTPRTFNLNQFNIKTKAKFITKSHPLLSIVAKIKRKLGYIQEGYWQKEKYFIKIADLIRLEFTPKIPLSTNTLKYAQIITPIINSVSVHIRRGDNVTNPCSIKYHGVCSLNYYQESFKKITEQIKTNDITVFVFSDDIVWARQNLILPYQTHFILGDNISNAEEIYLMSLCKHNIIANSSFSWWGAWLNQNPNKIVIAPKQWLVNKTADELDILPKDWIQM